MEYRIIYADREDLEHGLFGRKGSQNKNHKYLARLWIKDRWRYAYTNAELKALETFGKDFHGNKYSRERELELNKQRGELTDKLYDTEGKIIKSTFDKIKSKQKEKKVAKVKKTISKGPEAVAKEVSKSVNKNVKKALKNAGVYSETKQFANEIKSTTKSALKPITDSYKRYKVNRAIKRAKKKSQKAINSGKKFVENLFKR